MGRLSPDVAGSRAPVSPWRAGLACQCPRCGQGRLYAGFLKIADSCAVCGQSLKRADPGDGPAFFVMFIVGAIVVVLAIVVELVFEPAYWIHIVLWAPTVFALSGLFLRPAKAILVAFQFKNQARDFSDDAS